MGQMQDARLISASEQVIFPMIDKMIQDRVEVACGKFRSGSTDFIGDIAYITSLKDIYENLSALQRNGMAAYEKLIKENKDDGIRD